MYGPGRTALPRSALQSYASDNFVLPTSTPGPGLVGLSQSGSPSMTTILLVAAAAGAAWWFWLRKK